MEFKRVRPAVQFMLFIILMYGAYFGLRFTNFMPMFLCKNPPNYSTGCFIFPLHNLQYGLATLKQSLIMGQYSMVLSVPSYRYFWIGGEIGAVLTVFFVFILFILLFNNAWCGWACPVGSLQDVMTYLRTRISIRRIQLSDGLKKGLNYIKIISVTLFLTLPVACLFGVTNLHQSLTFCHICPVRGIMTLFNGSFENFSLTTQPGSFYNISASILSSIVFVLAFFFSRFFCLVCPVIGLAGVFNKFSFLKIKKDAPSCNSCGSCSKACPMDLKNISLKNKNREAVKDSCIQCYHCVDACPQSGALSVKFFGWKFFSSQKPCNFKSSQEKT